MSRMTLFERLIAYTLASEWSANRSDGNGPRCRICDALSNYGHGPHQRGCSLGLLCDDVRERLRTDEREGK